MPNDLITPVLLCGGSGTRLWPLSRKSYPKQFSALLGQETLFQASAGRVSGDGFANPLVLTNSDFRFIVAEQMAEIGVRENAILLEPEGRNTAPAILAAAIWLQKNDPGKLMLVTPCDHAIPDASAFQAAVQRGSAAARNGQIVTFGIVPTHPETGYGHLELSDVATGQDGPVPLTRFVEKPDLDTAREMTESGKFLWNAGLFLFSPETILAAFEEHAPEIIAPVRLAQKKARPDLGFLRLDEEAWQSAPNVSIDYAVMEHATNLMVVPFEGGWSDLGGWEAVWRLSDKDSSGVAGRGNVTAIDCENALLRSEDDAVELVGIGLKNVVAIAMPDAVLLAEKSQSQRVSAVVEKLKEKQAKQAVAFPRDHRPWGWFDCLALGDRFQVKRIVVQPGKALSLQSHAHRSEHWIVVQGTAKVTIGDQVSVISENQSVYIPLGEKHRLENPGKMSMVLIEVQTGSYLGEDDIERFEDLYARNENGD